MSKLFINEKDCVFLDAMGRHKGFTRGANDGNINVKLMGLTIEFNTQSNGVMIYKREARGGEWMEESFVIPWKAIRKVTKAKRLTITRCEDEVIEVNAGNGVFKVSTDAEYEPNPLSYGKREVTISLDEKVLSLLVARHTGILRPMLSGFIFGPNLIGCSDAHYMLCLKRQTGLKDGESFALLQETTNNENVLDNKRLVKLLLENDCLVVTRYEHAIELQGIMSDRSEFLFGHSTAGNNPPSLQQVLDGLENVSYRPKVLTLRDDDVEWLKRVPKTADYVSIDAKGKMTVNVGTACMSKFLTEHRSGVSLYVKPKYLVDAYNVGMREFTGEVDNRGEKVIGPLHAVSIEDSNIHTMIMPAVL